MTGNVLHPAAILIIGALLIPFLSGRVKQGYLLLLPIVAFITLLNTPEGHHWTVGFLDYELTLFRVTIFLTSQSTS